MLARQIILTIVSAQRADGEDDVQLTVRNEMITNVLDSNVKRE